MNLCHSLLYTPTDSRNKDVKTEIRAANSPLSFLLWDIYTGYLFCGEHTSPHSCYPYLILCLNSNVTSSDKPPVIPPTPPPHLNLIHSSLGYPILFGHRVDYFFFIYIFQLVIISFSQWSFDVCPPTRLSGLWGCPWPMQVVPHYFSKYSLIIHYRPVL